MKRFGWQALLGLFLVILSAMFYFLHYAIFRDPYHIFIYMLGDLAFVPIEIVVVTLIVHRLLEERERHIMREKLNLIIGVFFSEVGTRLLAFFSDFDPELDAIRNELIITGNWSEREFANVSKRLRSYDYTVDIQDSSSLEGLHDFLVAKRNSLLRLLENPNLLEHESFTELLRAVFHLTEELGARDDVYHLPSTDCDHLGNDINRVYGLLVHQWLDYMRHLKENYPYLFSFTMRTNPFDQQASPIVA